LKTTCLFISILILSSLKSSTLSSLTTMAIYDGSVEEMLGCVNISLEDFSSCLILFFLIAWDWELFKIDKLPLLAFMLTYLITTLRASFILFFFLVGANISPSYSSSSTSNPCCLWSVSKGRAQIARGTRLYYTKLIALVENPSFCTYIFNCCSTTNKVENFTYNCNLFFATTN
jgi:hypothetical protein